MKQGAAAAGFYIDKIDMPTMMRHLESAHEFFLDFQLPHIRRKLLEAIDCSRQNEVAFLILKFYDEYMHEVRKHMEYENQHIFLLCQAIAGRRKGDGLPHCTIFQ